MRVGPSQHTLTLSSPRASTLLRLGAELQAIVRRGNEGQLLLELDDGQVLTPRSSVPLRAGEQLQLRVLQLQPAPVLQILSANKPDAPLQASLRALLSSAGSRTSLETGFAQLLSAVAANDAPPALRPLLTALVALIRQPAQLSTSEGLAAAVRDSGLLLERRLLSEPQTAPQQELKTQLLRLAARLQAMSQPATTPAETPTANESIPRLTEITERLLARLETLQLQAASSEGLDLLFELPVQSNTELERLQLRIQDERASDAAQDGADSGGLLVRLHFGFADDALGAVLRLAGDAVRVHWWAEQAATADRLQAALPLLADRLKAFGLKTEEMSCLTGPPPTVDEMPILRTRGLLDEKA